MFDTIIEFAVAHPQLAFWGLSAIPMIISPVIVTCFTDGAAVALRNLMVALAVIAGVAVTVWLVNAWPIFMLALAVIYVMASLVITTIHVWLFKKMKRGLI